MQVTALGPEIKGIQLVQVGTRYAVTVDGVLGDTYLLRSGAELEATHKFIDRWGKR